MIDKLKQKKLYNEMAYLQSEIELIEAEIKEIEPDFAAYFQEFCSSNNIEMKKQTKNETCLPLRNVQTTVPKIKGFF